MAQSEANYLYLVLFLTQVTIIACVAGEGMNIQLSPHFPMIPGEDAGHLPIPVLEAQAKK